MRIPRGFADELRHQLDIVRVVSEYLTLKRRGANYQALCPFHQEKTPSFTVHPGKQIFKCFGCGRGGDVFRFVMDMENCDFPEVIRLLAERNGIAVPATKDEPAQQEKEQKERQWRDTLLEINRLAHEFFRDQLKTAEGGRAREYFQRREVSPETVDRLGLGYAPQSWEALSAFLRRKRVSEEEIARSGLVVPRESGQGHYDRFRGRLMFSVSDVQGRVVAFGGRTLDDDSGGGPKYMNSPETAVYTKGRHLYGLNHAKEAIRKSGFAILVEGYFDFLTAYQAGLGHIVASLGTALTNAQADLLRRYVGRIIVNFDPDPAGRAAAMRSLHTLIQRGFDVQVLLLPTGQDPDSFIRDSGLEAYQRLLAHPQTFLDFVIDQATLSGNLSAPADRARALREILPHVAMIPDRIERAASGDRVATRLLLDSKLVQDELRREIRNQANASGRDRTEAAPAERIPDLYGQVTQAERLLLEILLARADVAERLGEELRERADAFDETVTAPVFAVIMECLAQSKPIEYRVFTDAFHERADLLDVVERCLMAQMDRDSGVLYEEAKGCLARLEARRLEDELRRLQREIEAAQQKRDDELSLKLSMRKREVSNRLLKNTGRAQSGG